MNKEVKIPEELMYDYMIYQSIKDEGVQRFFAVCVSLYYGVIGLWGAVFRSIATAILFITFPIWALFFRIWRDIFLAHGQSKQN